MESIRKQPPCPLNILASHLLINDFIFLIADLHACTRGENQTPTHYAAKNDAAKALKVLLKLGGRMDDRDYKQRTPLQVAAELGKVIYWIKAWLVFICRENPRHSVISLFATVPDFAD